MFYLLLSILSVVGILFFILLIPIRMRLEASLKHIRLSILGIRVFYKRNDHFYQGIKETTKQPPEILKFRANYLKLLKDITFLENRVEIGGYDLDYSNGAVIFGISNAFLNNVKSVLSEYDIPFEYNSVFIGEFNVRYQTIFKLQIGRMLYKYYKIRRL